MSTNHESSFGARLKNANDCTSNIRGFNNYNPPRPEETPDSLATLTARVEQINAEVARLRSTYKTQAALRQQLFKNGSTSLEKLLSPISKAVGAQYGKNSDESKQVASIIRQMRATKLVLPPALKGENGQIEEKNSRSQRSFGSMAQFFKDLSATVTNFNGFAPSNSNITAEALTTLLENMNTANNSVAVAYQQLNNAQKERQAVYSDLAERIRRVKLYVASQYGNSSNEYKLISKLKV
jgi:hypothetical protein